MAEPEKSAKESVFKRVNQLGFTVLKSTPQHLLQPLPLVVQHNKQQHQQVHLTSAACSNLAAPSSTNQRTATATGNSSHAQANKVLRSSWGPGISTLLLPPLTLPNPSGLTRAGSSPASPYLDVSTAISIFNSTSNTSSDCCSPMPPHQWRQQRCCSPLSPSHPRSQQQQQQQQQAVRTSSGGNARCKSASALLAVAAGSTRTSSCPGGLKADVGLQLTVLSDHCISSGQGYSGTSRRAKAAAAVAAGIDAVHATHLQQRQRHRHWDSNTNPPVVPSLEEALQAWQQDLDAGVYGPRFLGSLAAVTSGEIKPTTGGGAMMLPLSGTAAGAGIAAARSAAADMSAMPAVFEGAADGALQALEDLVRREVVAKPHLTVMQLQRAIQAISQLGSPFQVAAISVLLRGGFWLAAMQVAYADFAVLAEVLLEMRSIIELGSNWNSQHLAAATWFWAGIDRDLFLRTFRGLGIISQYQQLRKQLAKVQQHQQQQHQHQQQQQQQVLLALAAGVNRSCRTGGGRGGLNGWNHPELAIAERLLLLHVIDNYLADIEAALANEATQRYSSGSGLITIAAAAADAAIDNIAGGSCEGGSMSSIAAHSSFQQALQITSDWMILTSQDGLPQGDGGCSLHSDRQLSSGQPAAKDGCALDSNTSSSSTAPQYSHFQVGRAADRVRQPGVAVSTDRALGHNRLASAAEPEAPLADLAQQHLMPPSVIPRLTRNGPGRQSPHQQHSPGQLVKAQVACRQCLSKPQDSVPAASGMLDTASSSGDNHCVAAAGAAAAAAATTSSKPAHKTTSSHRHGVPRSRSPLLAVTRPSSLSTAVKNMPESPVSLSATSSSAAACGSTVPAVLDMQTAGTLTAGKHQQHRDILTHAEEQQRPVPTSTGLAGAAAASAATTIFGGEIVPVPAALGSPAPCDVYPALPQQEQHQGHLPDPLSSEQQQQQQQQQQRNAGCGESVLPVDDDKLHQHVIDSQAGKPQPSKFSCTTAACTAVAAAGPAAAGPPQADTAALAGAAISAAAAGAALTAEQSPLPCVSGKVRHKRASVTGEDFDIFPTVQEMADAYFAGNSNNENTDEHTHTAEQAATLPEGQQAPLAVVALLPAQLLQPTAPQPPSAPCSRPQSLQASRCSSLAGSRPCSANVHHSSMSGTGPSRPSSAAAVTNGTRLPHACMQPASAAGTSGPLGGIGASGMCGNLNSRNGSRPWSAAAAHSSISRPGSAVAAAASQAGHVGGSRPASGHRLSRPGSAAAGLQDNNAMGASLQRLRDSCAEQRRGIQQMAQNIQLVLGEEVTGTGPGRSDPGPQLPAGPAAATASPAGKQNLSAMTLQEEEQGQPAAHPQEQQQQQLQQSVAGVPFSRSSSVPRLPLVEALNLENDGTEGLPLAVTGSLAASPTAHLQQGPEEDSRLTQGQLTVQRSTRQTIDSDCSNMDAVQCNGSAAQARMDAMQGVGSRSCKRLGGAGCASMAISGAGCSRLASSYWFGSTGGSTACSRSGSDGGDGSVSPHSDDPGLVNGPLEGLAPALDTPGGSAELQQEAAGSQGGSTAKDSSSLGQQQQEVTAAAAAAGQDGAADLGVQQSCSATGCSAETAWPTDGPPKTSDQGSVVNNQVPDQAVDVANTIQLFQQRLQQTALMAQQLMAQQLAGQEARRSSKSHSSSSRPASAAAHGCSSSSSNQSGGGAAMAAAAATAGAAAWGGVITPRLTAALCVDEPPTAQEVLEYACYLGMDPEQDAKLLHIAEEALTAPCPDGWTVHLDSSGNEFFYNQATQASSYEHPMDAHYRMLYHAEKAAAAAAAALT